ncbi:CII family transcriptional regulator [Escherichia coli]|uniref:CII family transcriptional regulator n=1 Tax=Escherichia coli TaxID=562 RepID=UPI003B000DCF
MIWQPEFTDKILSRKPGAVQRDVDRAETDLLINLSTLTQRGLAKMIGCHESKISHAVRQAKRKANMTYMKAYQKAWKEHRDRYQQDMEKLESENMELRRKLGEAKRDIDAYKRLFNGESHA